LEIADALGGALGTEVKVRPRGTGYKIELALDSLDAALALAQRVRGGA
jgi:ParB family chromosome partitioning protein